MAREFTMQSFGSLTTRLCGILYGGKEAEVIGFAAELEARVPFSACVKANTFYSTSVVAMGSCIGKILRHRRGAQVVNSIVSWVSINMIQHRRHRLAVDQKPRKPMRLKLVIPDDDVDLGALLDVSRNSTSPFGVPPLAGFPTWEVSQWSCAPAEFSSCLAVIQALADILARWQCSESHLILRTGSLVRRAVAWQALPFSAASYSTDAHEGLAP